MNKFTIISSNIMSMALLVASLPMVAADPNEPQHQYHPANYYVVNQYNVFQQQPNYFTELNAQQSALPYAPHLPPPLPPYMTPSQSSLAQNHYQYQSSEQQPNNPMNGQADFTQVSDKGSPYKNPELHIHHFSIKPPKHVGPARHTCPIEGCAKSYSRPSDLTCHIQLKHLEYAQEQGLVLGKYQCTQNDCPARFSREKTLDRHMNQYHPHAKLRYIDATASASQAAKEEDEDDHGRQEQTHNQQPLSKFSLSFICGE